MKAIDLTGHKYGKLTVVRFAEQRGKKKYWQCLCECGKTVVAEGSNLRSGNTTSCGCQIRESLIANKSIAGQRFGKLVAVKYVSSDKHGQSQYLCRCDCGKEVVVRRDSLVRGLTVSCGCKLAENLARAVRQTYEDAKVYGTNPGRIASVEPSKNSTTKIKGVYYLKKEQTYRAYIGFQGKKYYLLQSQNIKDCIRAREEAEKHIYGEFLDWYEKNVRELKNGSRRTQKSRNDRYI